MSLRLLRQKLDEYYQLKNVDIFDPINEYKSHWLTLFKNSSLLVECINNLHTLEELRLLTRYNLYFMLVGICNKHHLISTWAENRCREAVLNPNGHIQLWSRAHYKSTIWTFGKTIQDILISHGEPINYEKISISFLKSLMKCHHCTIENVFEFKQHLEKYFFKTEVCVGIFSATRTLAQAFLKEIMNEFEQNKLLIQLFNDILYSNPQRDSPSWGVSTGCTVKRKNNRKEATIEAWGLLSGQPTSKHFTICIFDDVLTEEVAKSFVKSAKLISEWSNAFYLGSQGGAYRACATRKNYNDVYSIMMERKAFIPIIFSCYDEHGKGYIWTDEEIEDIRRKSGEETFASECLQEPLKDSALRFDISKIKYHQLTNLNNLNLYFFCDPANSKNKDSDYTVMLVLGVDQGGSLILIDGIRERLSPSEKWNKLYGLYNQYRQVKKIYYEEVSLCSDIAYFTKCAQHVNNLTFTSLLHSLKPEGQKKIDRIIRIEILLNEGKLFLPRTLIKTAANGTKYNLVEQVIHEEIKLFPYSKHDDAMDTLGYAVRQLERGELILPVINQQKVIDLNQYNRGSTFENF